MLEILQAVSASGPLEEPWEVPLFVCALVTLLQIQAFLSILARCLYIFERRCATYSVQLYNI